MHKKVQGVHVGDVSDTDRLLAAAAAGDEHSAARLLPVIYEELRRLAHDRMRNEPAGHSLQTTALVHEAYLRLVADKPTGWTGRGHFFGAAAEAMRRILIDRARSKKTRKRGGEHRRIALDAVEPFIEPEPDDLLALDEALGKLECQDARASEVVKLRCFAGLSIEEIGQVLDMNPRTVYREWDVACAWLRTEMRVSDDDS